MSVSSVFYTIFLLQKKTKKKCNIFSDEELFISHIYCFHTFVISLSQTLEIIHTTCPVLWWHLSKGTTIIFPISITPVLLYLVEWIHLEDKGVHWLQFSCPCVITRRVNSWGSVIWKYIFFYVLLFFCTLLSIDFTTTLKLNQTHSCCLLSEYVSVHAKYLKFSLNMFFFPLLCLLHLKPSEVSLSATVFICMRLCQQLKVFHTFFTLWALFYLVSLMLLALRNSQVLYLILFLLTAVLLYFQLVFILHTLTARISLP